ncbi:MAG: creatininase family protein [Thermodesulfobacteriota bacterium]
MILEEITMEEFGRGLEKTRTLLVPYGSVEAHGTHLPLFTDTLVIEEVLRKAALVEPAFVAPAVKYGVCTSTGRHPGTLSITPDTLRRVTADLVRDGARKGIEKFVLISGHGGSIHVAAIKEAAEYVAHEPGLAGVVTVAALSIYEILGPEARDLAETPGDSHAGEMETSLVMHLAPGLVRGTSPEDYPRLPKPVIATDKMRYWKSAVWGDPSKATREKGERLFNMMVEAVVGLTRRMDAVR